MEAGREAEGTGSGRLGWWKLLWRRLGEAGPLLDAGDAERKEKERGIVEELAHEICRSGFGAAALMMAESSKPISRVGSHFLHLFSPSVGMLFGPYRMANLACILGDRDNLEHFVRQIEKLDGERARKARGRRRREPLGDS